MKILRLQEKLQKKNLPNKGLLIFDLDGTLIDSKKDIINSFNHAFKKNKLDLIDNTFFYKNASRGSNYFIKKNIKKSNSQNISITKINNDFISHYSKNCVKDTKCKKGLIKFLKQSKKIYINIISTNKKKAIAQKIFKNLKILEYFDDIYGSDTLLEKKPSKKHLDEILKKYNVKNSKIAIFGDSEVDYKLSSHYKLKYILIKNGYTHKKFWEIKHSLLINDFKDLLKSVNKLLNIKN
jgi:HAD superfamily hydrolase (TIGR01549 family)